MAVGALFRCCRSGKNYVLSHRRHGVDAEPASVDAIVDVALGTPPNPVLIDPCIRTPVPWLSILLPVYKVDEYLPACLGSILSQEIDGVEVLIVEDGSGDAGSQVIEDWRLRHPGVIRVVTHSNNRGVSAARNSLLEYARGHYLWFVDPDDLMEPGAVLALKRIVDARPVDLVMCDFRLIRQQEASTKHVCGLTLKHRAPARDRHVRTFDGPIDRLCTANDDLVGGMFAAGHMHAWSKVVRRAAWPRSLRFPEGRVFEDMTVFPRLALSVRSWFYAGQVWIAYRRRDGSILSSLSERQLNDWMTALAGYAAELCAAKTSFRRDTLFKVAHFHHRSLHCCTKKHREIAPAIEVRRRVVRCVRDWNDSSPLSIDDLSRGYLRRLRLRQWLRLLSYARTC